ncbi:DMT family transporter [Ruminococcus sp.]|uniref:DMT family transporter n=1 Tax=Ruminococcus sp. TaxID=41978 RepID=UPI002E82350A|nr:DMT family transporter [Ruminococcus sp.]MEE3491499.1 DMT family transporter [Ruminococcus sp.]
MSNRTKGILLLILSAFFFACMNMFVKLSGDELPVFQKVFFRNAMASVIAFIVLIKNKAPLRPTVKGSWKYLVLRTLFGLTGVVCNYYALETLVLSDASILNKMSPFFAVIFSFIFIHERPKLYQWLVLGGALFGTVFVIKPSFANAAFIPALVGFLGGVCAGAAYGCVRKLGLMGESNPYIVFFFSTASTLIVTPIMIAGYVPMTALQWVYLLSAGVSAALAQFSITAAYTYAPAKEISVYDFSQIIFASLMSLIVFQQVPDIWSVVGYVIIISMAILNYFLSREKITKNPE